MWTALVVKVSRVSLPRLLFRHSGGSVNSPSRCLRLKAGTLSGEAASPVPLPLCCVSESLDL